MTRVAYVGHCEGCKFWGLGRRPITGLNLDSKRHCGQLTYERNCEDRLVFLESGDYASSEGVLWTEPNFGCLLFEAK